MDWSLHRRLSIMPDSGGYIWVQGEGEHYCLKRISHVGLTQWVQIHAHDSLICPFVIICVRHTLAVGDSFVCACVLFVTAYTMDDDTF